MSDDYGPNGPNGTSTVMVLVILFIVGGGWLAFWLFADCSTLGHVLPVTEMPGRCANFIK